MLLDAAGVSDATIAAIVGGPSAMLLVRHHRSVRGFVQVEALAPSPLGERVGQPIRLRASPDSSRR